MGVDEGDVGGGWVENQKVLMIFSYNVTNLLATTL